MPDSELRIVVLEPDKPACVKVIPNTLEAMQGVVNGYIEIAGRFRIADRKKNLEISGVVICNEEGRLLALPLQVVPWVGRVAGTIFFVSDDPPEMVSLPEPHAARLVEVLNHALGREEQ